MATWDVTLNVTALNMPLSDNDIYNMQDQGLDPASNTDQKLYIEKALLKRGDMALARVLAHRDLTPAEITVTLNTP